MALDFTCQTSVRIWYDLISGDSWNIKTCHRLELSVEYDIEKITIGLIGDTDD